ncbi:MAG: PEP-CTERM sorting domain-containing protein [Phycisphaerales bacterium]|nr:MAG: PEP-CTERM sorting domain-containing protein [Phycisphaerales bacterium]
MMKFQKASTILIVAVLSLCLPCVVRAYPVGTVEIVNTGNAASETITVWGGGLDGADVYAGVYTFEKTAGTGEGKLWDNGLVTGFCAELSETVPTITSKYSVIGLEKGPVPTGFLGGPMGQGKADYIRELWGRFYDPSWATEGQHTWKRSSRAAAFASAIWEIIYEDLPAKPAKWDVTVDGSAGALGFASEWVDSDLANGWLHALDGTGPKADLRVFSFDGSQDYIAQVPEPATIVLLGLGGVFSLFRRKRNAA